MPPRVSVVGAVAIDVKARSLGPLVRRADVPGRVRVTLGGVGHNLALNLARRGARVRLFSAVGDDAFGRWMQEALTAAQVEAEFIVSREQDTCTFAAVLDETGDMEVGVFGGEVLNAITPKWIEAQVDSLTDAEWIACDATIPRPALDTVIALGHARGCSLYLNPASVAWAQTVVDFCAAFDLVAANALETAVLTGLAVNTVTGAQSAAQQLVSRGIRQVIVTLGDQGAVYADETQVLYRPAHPTKVVDTTGAGDALAAAFLLCHMEGRSPAQCLECGLEAAAKTAACEESVVGED